MVGAKDQDRLRLPRVRNHDPRTRDRFLPADVFDELLELEQPRDRRRRRRARDHEYRREHEPPQRTTARVREEEPHASPPSIARSPPPSSSSGSDEPPSNHIGTARTKSASARRYRASDEIE